MDSRSEWIFGFHCIVHPVHGTIGWDVYFEGKLGQPSRSQSISTTLKLGLIMVVPSNIYSISHKTNHIELSAQLSDCIGLTEV